MFYQFPSSSCFFLISVSFSFFNTDFFMFFLLLVLHVIQLLKCSNCDFGIHQQYWLPFKCTLNVPFTGNTCLLHIPLEQKDIFNHHFYTVNACFPLSDFKVIKENWVMVFKEWCFGCVQHYPTLLPLIAITRGGPSYYHFDSLQKFLY